MKRNFLSFEEKGLGKTSVTKHSIQLIKGAEPVKERFYPISPAVQELLFTEVDNMLQLGVRSLVGAE